jgi:hypothetical protein
MVLEPIEEKDLNLEGKLGKVTPLEKKVEGGPVAVEKEVSQEIGAAEKENAYTKILSKIQAQQQPVISSEEVGTDAKSVSRKTDAESQIQHLVDLALAKGVVHAVKVARHLEDNYVLDVFHDRLLADELHEALLKKGLIKEL